MKEERIGVPGPGGKGVDVGPLQRPDRNDRIARGVVRDMRLLARSLAGSTAVFLAASASALAQGENCTHDTLAIDGTATAATFCVAGPPAARVTVTETFARGDKRLSRPLTIDVVDGATVTRAVDDVSLADLGSDKELHLVIAYRGGSAVLEHALLLPGAVVLK
jgi:hypothetical protein